ncbi:UNVERIFIED_CONTAM: hypothetical protein Sindi_2278900, partial [Sesamum indicum]
MPRHNEHLVRGIVVHWCTYIAQLQQFLDQWLRYTSIRHFGLDDARITIFRNMYSTFMHILHRRLYD